MTSWLTDKRFLVGVAVGTLVMPYVLRTARAQVDRLKG